MVTTMIDRRNTIFAKINIFTEFPILVALFWNWSYFFNIFLLLNCIVFRWDQLQKTMIKKRRIKSVSSSAIETYPYITPFLITNPLAVDPEKCMSWTILRNSSGLALCSRRRQWEYCKTLKNFLFIICAYCNLNYCTNDSTVSESVSKKSFIIGSS